MKKILTFILFVVLITSLFSCKIIDSITGKDDTVTDNETNENTNNTEQDPVSDEEKLNLMFADLKSAVKVQNNSLQIPEIINKYVSGLDFSLEDIELNDEKEASSIIFKNNTLYISSGEYAEQIIRFSEYGILTVSETNGEVASSLMTYDQLLGDLPTVDIQAILDSIVIKQGDLQKTEKEHVYTVNRSLLLRIGKALSGDPSFTIDKATAPTVTLDMTAYENAVNDRVIQLSIYDKSTEETTEITISLNDPYEENNKRLTFSIRSTDVKLDGHIIFGDDKLKNVKFDSKIIEDGQEIYTQFNCLFEDNSVSNILLNMSDDTSELEIDAALSNDGDIENLKVDLITNIEEKQTLDLKLEYDKSSASRVGNNIISARLLLTAENENSVNILFHIRTDEYSTESAQYTVMLEYPDGDKTATGTAKIYSPAKSNPKVSTKASLYLNHGSKILLSYPDYLEKAESLNNQMMGILNSGNFSSLKTNWVTYDAATGIYFLTSISSANGGYISTTYSSPDAFKYAYVYPQNLGGFKKEGSSYAERDALRIFELIAEDVPAGTVKSTRNTFYTYTYIDKYDLYLMVDSFSHADFVVLTSEPTEEQTYNGANIHKLKYDENAKVKIHTYEQKTSDSCMIYYECTHCKAVAYPIDDTYAHNYGAKIAENDENGNTIWDFRYCQSCCKGKVNIYSGELTIELKLEEMTDEFMTELRRCEGFENFNLSSDDYAHSLVITGMLIHEGDASSYEITEIVIPTLSEYCDYSIVGIDNAGNNWITELPLHIIIPEGVEFINEHAFGTCRFVAKITLPSTLKIIGRYAFNSCTNLTEVIFNNDNLYIADDAFYNTSIEITS